MNIRRNAQCPCGSGKRYKRCCGALIEPQARSELKPPVGQPADMLRAIQAAENVRRQQQGHGKPIISFTHSGYRVVAVGNEVFWGRNWLVFPDFLFYFLRKTVGFNWGSDAKKEENTHPLIRWLAKTKDYMSMHFSGKGRVHSGQTVGFLASTIHFAYALYLIAHNDKIPKRLLRRLREPKTFMPAYYETLVGAALAVAGFEIENAETQAGSLSTPEFRARSKASGKVYEVEAKRKDRWIAQTNDVNSESFKKELARYVRHQIYNASKKKLRNPIFWVELSIPTLSTEAEWRTIGAQVKSVISEAERMTVNGAPISSAFVVITNHTFLANEDIAGEPAFAFLETLHIPDYPFGRTMEIEDALEGYDKHRDVIWMMEAWRLARRIPTTFDGTPPELLLPSGQTEKTVQIGDMMIVPDQDGNEVVARIEEIASHGDKATVAVYDSATNRRWLARLPLSPGETRAAARYTDAIFGKANAPRGLRDGDPFDLYDFFLRAYAQTNPEQLAKLIREDAGLRQYEGLSPAEARRRIAREYTKRMWARRDMAPRS